MPHGTCMYVVQYCLLSTCTQDLVEASITLVRSKLKEHAHVSGGMPNQGITVLLPIRACSAVSSAICHSSLET